MTKQASAFTAPATTTTTRPEQAHGGMLKLDTIALLRMVEQGETLAAIDHVAEALKSNLGWGARVIVALATSDRGTALLWSADGRDEETQFLREIDFSDADLQADMACLRLNVAGARPFEESGDGAPLLRAIAAGLKEAIRLPIAANDAGSAGSLTVFLPDAVEKPEWMMASLRAAQQAIEALASLRRTVLSASESNARFAELSSTLPGVVYQRVVTPEGQIRYSYISENAYDLFGVTAETILTDPEALFAHYGAEYRQSFRQKLIQASKDMTIWDVEATIQRPDGQVRYTHAIARPRREADGSVVWTGVILDATRIKLAEMAAAESNARFAELSSTLPGVVYQRVVTPEGQIRYSYISENAYDLFGVTAETILTDPEALFSHYSAEYRQSFRQKLIQASKDMTIWDVEAIIQRPDGQVRYTHAIARPRREADGSVVWTGVILDSTRIKLAEMAAADAETRTREAILESLSQGVLLFDQDDRLLLFNSHFIDLYPTLAGVAQKGVKYEDLLRYELVSDLTRDAGLLSGASEFRDRLARRGEPHLVYEREMAGDRHMLINEYRTPDRTTVVLYTDISELKQRERKIEHLAHHDALTGLPNRVLFQERLTEAMVHATARNEYVTVICLDLDRFKSVNDTLGHHFGDLLLQEVARRIRTVLGENDTACRLGGDEFAVICPGFATMDQATSFAWRLLDVLSKPHVIKGQAVMGGTSIGIAISGRDGLSPDTLLRNADLALYRAKSDGRGTFRFFEQEMDLKAQARRMMELALRLAIERNELELHYQPLVDAHTSQIMGAEALLRWNMAGQGYVSPAEFVPLAEDTGLIGDIGRWVLARACADAAKWKNDVRIAVNLSPAQLRNLDFVNFVRDTLKTTGLAPRRLELEITEGMLLHNTEANTRMLLELKKLGVRISMDDFGTGYSSLGNLRSFPFDKIKIDKSFISDLSTRADAAAIIRAILTLGRSLGMTTTAEGVETRDQLAYLRSEGCMEVQGYYFAKAMQNEEFCEMLRLQTANAVDIYGERAG